MTSSDAASFAYNELRKHGLGSWSVRISKAANHNWFLGLCSHRDKCIIVNGFHVEMHPEAEVTNTIRHEVAHALTPGHKHDDVWASKAREIGCDNTNPCSHLSLSDNVIDAIRSGADIELEVEEQVIRTVKHRITQLKDKCPACGKDAVELRSNLVPGEETDKKFIFLKCGHLLVKTIPKATPFNKLRSNDINPDTGEPYQPYPFQIEGMQFLERALAIGKGGAIFDEMGLGKTVQAIGYIKYHLEEVKPVMYGVKSATSYQWLKELFRWSGEIAQVVEKSTDILLPCFDHYIISYDLLVPKVKKLKSGKIVHQGFDVQKLINRGIKLVVLDECQQIKNVDASRTHQIRLIAKHAKVIALSGTPWKNRGGEFFSVLNMLDPMKFGSHAGFLNQWVDYYAHGNKWKEGGIRNIPMFKEAIKDIAIRREVEEVYKQMPEVSRTIFTCNLDEFYQKQYEDEVDEFVKKQTQRILDGTDDSSNMEVIGDLNRMRHITAISKIPVTLEWAREFYEETDRKLVIFVHHIDVGQMMFEGLKKMFPDLPILQITGDMNGREKGETADRFNASPRAFMVASTQAAGEGLNLQTCSDAILHERQWNPGNEDQAAPGRFRRIGQKNRMNVIFVTARGTIDDFVAQIVEYKRGIFHNLMNKGEAAQWNQGDVIKDLISMLIKDHNKKKRAS